MATERPHIKLRFFDPEERILIEVEDVVTNFHHSLSIEADDLIRLSFTIKGTEQWVADLFSILAIGLPAFIKYGYRSGRYSPEYKYYVIGYGDAVASQGQQITLTLSDEGYFLRRECLLENLAQPGAGAGVPAEDDANTKGLKLTYNGTSTEISGTNEFLEKLQFGDLAKLLSDEASGKKGDPNNEPKVSIMPVLRMIARRNGLLLYTSVDGNNEARDQDLVIDQMPQTGQSYSDVLSYFKSKVDEGLRVWYVQHDHRGSVDADNNPRNALYFVRRNYKGRSLARYRPRNADSIVLGFSCNYTYMYQGSAGGLVTGLGTSNAASLIDTNEQKTGIKLTYDGTDAFLKAVLNFAGVNVQVSPEPTAERPTRVNTSEAAEFLVRPASVDRHPPINYQVSSNVFRIPSPIDVASTQLTQEGAAVIGQKKATQQHNAFRAVLKIVGTPNPVVSEDSALFGLNQIITIKDVSGISDGNYLVVAIVHSVSQGSPYTTELSLIRNATNLGKIAFSTRRLNIAEDAAVEPTKQSEEAFKEPAVKIEPPPPPPEVSNPVVPPEPKVTPPKPPLPNQPLRGLVPPSDFGDPFDF